MLQSRCFKYIHTLQATSYDTRQREISSLMKQETHWKLCQLSMSEDTQ